MIMMNVGRTETENARRKAAFSKTTSQAMAIWNSHLRLVLPSINTIIEKAHQLTAIQRLEASPNSYERYRKSLCPAEIVDKEEDCCAFGLHIER
ncbi:hypothetical protein ACJMK2_032534 [Sinanodonta woodiana]|uniref:Uncharacterized protein n=1 Tax=Sinanodonta woodiana TaxID=1069815 RepID=A0ABD3X3V6_SINWO